MTKRNLVAMTALLLGAVGAWPALAGGDCSQARTQTELNACVGDDYAKADRTLNMLYDRLMKRLEGEDHARLRDAERAWIGFRDKHCAFVGGPSEGGTAHPMVVGSCLAELTAARAGELLYQLTCEEGDLSCVR